MLNLGQFNQLTVSETLPFGFMLRSQQGDEALLHTDNTAEHSLNIGDSVDALIYLDKQGQYNATLKPPKVLCDHSAALTVVGVTKHGAFVDWGVDRDLFVPVAQQDRMMQTGLTYLVHVYVDEKYQQLQGSTRLHRFYPEYDDQLKAGDRVNLTIASKTDMGYKVLIEQRCLGLIFKSDVFMPLRIGQTLEGFIKQVRSDGKLDVALQRDDDSGRQSLQDQILDDLVAHGGMSTLTDKSPASEITQRFGVSKGAYKKALGALFKQRKIKIAKDIITLLSEEQS